jgi:hypothetical protein
LVFYEYELCQNTPHDCGPNVTKNKKIFGLNPAPSITISIFFLFISVKNVLF